MSTQYSVEPQPTAKALLHTTTGDIELSLWGKQCPLATRNFLQHCLDGYFTGTIFHRLVPGFILQGGDPTGLGTGGQSALSPHGAPFADEFHPRLRYNRRGLLGMANSGTKDDNGSQFFLTLGATPELQGKNTLFGRVEGDTIFNLMRMGEAELAEDGADRPLYPTQVTGAEVLVNPYEDMVARPKTDSNSAGGVKDKQAAKKKRKAGKGALSFGEEVDSHPVVKRTRVNPSFQESGEPDQDVEKEMFRSRNTAVTTRLRRTSTSSVSENSQEEAALVPPEEDTVASKPRRNASHSPAPEPDQVQKTMSALERTNEEIAALKRAMKKNNNSRNGSAEEAQRATSAKKSSTTTLESMIPSTSTRGRKRGKAGADDDAGFAMFNAFRRKLVQTASTPATAGKTNGSTHVNNGKSTHPGGGAATTTDDDDVEAKTCDLHFIVDCQSCSRWDEGGKSKGAVDDDDEDADDNVDDPNWMSHRLVFGKDLLGKDLEWKKRMEELEVIDPREKTRALREDRSRGKDRGGHDKKGGRLGKEQSSHSGRDGKDRR